MGVAEPISGLQEAVQWQPGPLKTGADAVAAFVEAMGITTVFGLAGESVAHLMQAVSRREPRLRYVSARHEHSAACMADGFYRATGRPAAVLAHIGAGALNVLHGMANALRDGNRVLALTGNDRLDVLGRGVWHEVDHLALFRPVSHWAARLETIDQIPWVMYNAALRLLEPAGRPGPVYVDVLANVAEGELTAAQRAKIEAALEDVVRLRSGLDCAGQGGAAAAGSILRAQPHEGAMREIARALWNAERPLILAGGGVTAAGEGAWESLRAVAESTGWPVVTTDTARGVVPETAPYAMGPIGMLSWRAGRAAAEGVDVLLVVGANLSDIVTFRWQLFQGTTIFQVDIDPGQIGRHYRVELGVTADAAAFLTALRREVDALAAAGARPPRLDRSRLERLTKAKEQARSEAIPSQSSDDPITRGDVIVALRQVKGARDVVACGAGVHSRWGKLVDIERPRTFLKSVGMGSMGYAFPASIGASIGLLEDGSGSDAPRAYVIVGDGDFSMGCTELETALRCGARVAVIVFNDRVLGATLEHQERVFGKAVGVRLGAIDFAQIAAACGVPGYRVETRRQLEEALREVAQSPGPAVIDVILDGTSS